MAFLIKSISKSQGFICFLLFVLFLSSLSKGLLFPKINQELNGQSNLIKDGCKLLHLGSLLQYAFLLNNLEFITFFLFISSILVLLPWSFLVTDIKLKKKQTKTQWLNRKLILSKSKISSTYTTKFFFCLILNLVFLIAFDYGLHISLSLQGTETKFDYSASWDQYLYDKQQQFNHKSFFKNAKEKFPAEIGCSILFTTELSFNFYVMVFYIIIELWINLMVLLIALSFVQLFVLSISHSARLSRIENILPSLDSQNQSRLVRNRNVYFFLESLDIGLYGDSDKTFLPYLTLDQLRASSESSTQNLIEFNLISV